MGFELMTMRDKHLMSKRTLAAVPFVLVIVVASIATAGAMAFLLLIAAGLFGYPLYAGRPAAAPATQASSASQS